MNQYAKYLITAALFACVFIIPLVQAKADRYSVELEEIDLVLQELQEAYPVATTPTMITVCWSASQQRLVPAYQGCK